MLALLRVLMLLCSMTGVTAGLVLAQHPVSRLALANWFWTHVIHHSYRKPGRLPCQHSVHVFRVVDQPGPISHIAEHAFKHAFCIVVDAAAMFHMGNVCLSFFLSTVSSFRSVCPEDCKEGFHLGQDDATSSNQLQTPTVVCILGTQWQDD